MWEKIAGLIEEIDAQLIVLNADVHVHAADHEAPPDAGQVLGNRLIARPLRGLLRTPARKGMGRGGDRRQAVLGGKISHRATQACELRARLARSLMHAGAHLDLGFEELARDLGLQSLLGGLEQGLRHLAHEIARRLVDEEVFLFDANAKGRILEGHGQMLARFGWPSNCRTLAGPAILGMVAGAVRPCAIHQGSAAPSSQAAAWGHSVARKAERKNPRCPIFFAFASARRTGQMLRSLLAVKWLAICPTAAGVPHTSSSIWAKRTGAFSVAKWRTSTSVGSPKINSGVMHQPAHSRKAGPGMFSPPIKTPGR